MSDLLTLRLGRVCQLGHSVRAQLSEIAERLDRRVLNNDPPSLAERVALHGLVRRLSAQAALMKRMDESWQGLTLRSQSMGQLAAGRIELPAMVQDPFSEEPRHLHVGRFDVSTVEQCLDDMSEVAHAARTMELAPLLTSLHHMRARLCGVIEWSPDARTRLHADAVYRRSMPDRR